MKLFRHVFIGFILLGSAFFLILHYSPTLFLANIFPTFKDVKLDKCKASWIKGPALNCESFSYISLPQKINIKGHNLQTIFLNFFPLKIHVVSGNTDLMYKNKLFAIAQLEGEIQKSKGIFLLDIPSLGPITLPLQYVVNDRILIKNLKGQYHHKALTIQHSEVSHIHLMNGPIYLFNLDGEVTSTKKSLFLTFTSSSQVSQTLGLLHFKKKWQMPLIEMGFNLFRDDKGNVRVPLELEDDQIVLANIPFKINH